MPSLLSERPHYEVLNEEMYRQNAIALLKDTMKHAKPAPKIPILEWCEKHFVNPTGSKAGLPYNRRDQPATALLLELLTDTYWRSCMLVGPNQAGKSLTLAQFMLHVNFNLCEDVIFGVPDLDGMWRTKYHKDILPVLNSSSLRDQIPKNGAGSAGGTPKLLQWNNHTTLTPMGAGGGDSQRSGATSRVLVVTEIKDFGESALSSDEGSKFDQLSRRTLNFQGREMIFGESTLTTTDNIAWQWFLQGTQSMPHFPCESCEEFICPEREHLVGWQDARTEEEAAEKSQFSCPECGVLIDEAKRRRLLQESVVLHKGQTVDRGKVVGPVPPTRKLSYRFTSSTNMFANAGFIGVKEWILARELSKVRRGQLEREIMQSIYALPSNASAYSVDPLDGNALMRRATGDEWGFVPAGYSQLWGGVDVRKSAMHWSVVATGDAVGPKLIAWGEQRVLQDIPLEQALPLAAQDIQDRFRDGFQIADSQETLPVTLTLMDSGWKDTLVYDACDRDDFWLPLKGFGSGFLRDMKYKKPEKTTAVIRHIGDSFDVKYMDGRWVVHCNASDFKSRLHESLRLEVGSERAMTIAKGSPAQLRGLIDHLTAEKEKFSGEAGESTSVWEEIREQNHWLDSTSYANLSSFVWKFLQDLIETQEEDDGSYTVIGDGPLFA